MSAAFDRIRDLRGHEARLEAELAQVRREIRPAEKDASLALNSTCVIRGERLLNAIDRATGTITPADLAQAA